MKKILLLLLLFISAQMVLAESKEVQMEAIKSNRPTTRSLVLKPIVTIDDQTCVLSVKLLSSDSYTLRVLDAVGMEICQFTVISDGTQHPYSLPLLKSGSHTIVIESSNRSYEGEFTI